ncbi:unnamed protein product [Mytilus edulis]|uniref:DUF6589 domain-containing protein n=1 Tax=Mytilus edulis TaxID=6550 RepID=A0A8S3SIQ3_MYTED|nr:unnamed protein product [Mytilus edulis]
MYNYFNNLAQWFVHIEVLNKTAKDGDITSIIPNLLMSLPLFYNHSTLSKYLVECINYVIQLEYLLSPLMKLRVLEGSFVNVEGGRSNNVESDLLQEHSVRKQKFLIKQLGANKTQKAIERASAAAGAIAAINDNIAISLEITPKSSRHIKTLSPGEQQVMSDVLQDLKPFKFTPGRKYEGFEKLGENVFACIDGSKMKIDLDIIVNRLLSGHVDFGNDDIDSNSDSDSDDDDMPDL